jgi:hypothetical protein
MKTYLICYMTFKNGVQGFGHVFYTTEDIMDMNKLNSINEQMTKDLNVERTIFTSFARMESQP